MMKTIFLVSIILNIVYGIPDENRIVEGRPAKPGQFPYIVSLRRRITPHFAAHFCGGSIIGEHWILTAAHCFPKGLNGREVIYAGTNSLHNGGDEYHIEKMIMHPDYHGGPYYIDDIALIKTTKRIHFHHHVSPIHLDRHFVTGETHVTVSGWGFTRYPHGSVSTELLYADLMTISVDKCAEMMLGQSKITSAQLCTFTRIGQGTCHADSGGPLAEEGVLVGIVSVGKPCAIGYPDVFTRVAYYLDWIQEQIRHH